MDFDDLYQSGRKRGFSGNKKLRLFCIFLVVAALTGIILWKIVPRQPAGEGAVSEKQPAKEQTPAVSEKGNAVPEKTKSVSAAESGRAVQSPENSIRPKQANSKTPLVSPQKQTQRADFAKGAVSPGDLPPELDKPVVPAESKLTQSISQHLSELENMMREKKFAAASVLGANLLPSLTEGSEPYRKVLFQLTEANWQRFLSGDTSDGFAVTHTVRSGDRVGSLVRKHRTTIPAVMLANRLQSSNKIQIGQRLILLPGKWQIKVSKSQRLLLLLRNDAVFAGFDVGIGRFGKTPAADFVIAERLKHPVYRTLDGRIYKHGEQGNELGDYFLKLAAAGKPGMPLLGYGIHGTPDETTVSRSLSNGCIRMRNKDVEKLYVLVPSGVPVTIRN